MVMTESPIRRACNRCHAQKLSCKRSGDEPCERCIRLKAECKSSPSLRYRKNQHPNGTSDNSSSRPPKRRRTHEGSGVAQDELESDTRGGPSGDMIQIAMNHVSASGVGFSQPYPAVDLANFGFDFGVPEMYNPTPNNPPGPPPFLRRPGMDGITDLLDPESTLDPWSNQLPAASSPYSDTELFSSASADTGKPRSAFHSHHSSLSLLPASGQQEAPHTLPDGQQFTPIARRRIMLKSSPRQATIESRWLADISDINSKLWDVAASIPVLTESIDDTDIYTYMPTEHEDSLSNPKFSIDPIFKLSRRFISTLQEMIRSVTSASSAMGPGHHSPKAERQLDPGSSLLILSTYVRILELYQKVFHLVNIELSSTGGKEPLQLCRLPDVSLGSFQVVSSQSLQMILTIRLAEEFLADLRRVIVSLDPAPAGTGPDSQSSLFAGVVAVSLNEVTAREKQIQHDLSTIRTKLEA